MRNSDHTPELYSIYEQVRGIGDEQICRLAILRIADHTWPQLDVPRWSICYWREKLIVANFSVACWFRLTHAEHRD